MLDQLGVCRVGKGLLTCEHGGSSSDVIPAAFEVEQVSAHQTAQQVREVVHL